MSSHLKEDKSYNSRQDESANVCFPSALYQEYLFHNLIVVRKVLWLCKLGRHR